MSALRNGCESRLPMVVVVISNLEYGGAQRQVVELANHMDPARFDVHVCSLSDYVPLAAELQRREERLHIIHKRWKFDYSVVPRLAKLLWGLQADVVHSYLFDADIAARLAGRKARTPVVINSERNTDYHLKRRQLAAYWLTRRCVDLIIANSRAGAAFNSRMLGHDAGFYRVVHNGVNTETFKRGDAVAVRRRLGLDPSERVIGMFTSFKAQKNHALIFRAFKRLLQDGVEARLMLVGDELYAGMHGSDAYKIQMNALVDELGIRERCLFLGNRNDVADLYCACDLTVLPSLFEGTPNVLLESMACGVPIVATDVSDNAMVAPDGRVGYIIQLGDEAALAERIGQLLKNESLRREMGAAARKWVATEFSCARLASRTAEVYEAALAAATQPKTSHRELVPKRVLE